MTQPDMPATQPALPPQYIVRSSFLLWRRSLILCVLFWVVAGFFYVVLTSQRPSASDFFMTVYATRGMVFEGRDPYADQMTNDIQRALYGDVLSPDIADRMSFKYPLSTSVFLVPFTLIPYAWAEALWDAINIFAMGGAIWALIRLSGWRGGSLIERQLPYLCAYLCYPFFFTMGYGQYTVVALFFAAMGALLLRDGHYSWGGVIVSLSIIKPQIGAVLVACLLFWSVLRWRHRYPALLSSGMCGVVLYALGALWMVDWPLRALSASGYYRTHPPLYLSYIEDVLHYFGVALTTAQALALPCTAAIIVALLYLWWCAADAGEWVGSLFALSALLSLSLLPQYGLPNDIIFYPAALFGLVWLRKRLAARTGVAIALSLTLGLYVPLVIDRILIHGLLLLISIGWLIASIRRARTIKRRTNPQHN